MADPKGFMTTPRQTPARRPVDIRITDWREVYLGQSRGDTERQAGRCMDCGVPFCHQGCPLGNLIPEWNDLVWRRDWREAAERLHATNNFPEFTGRLCPAPCESACVLGISADPVTIKQVEVEIVDRAWAEGWVTAQPPSPSARAAGRRVAVVGSGPAGLAAAQQLTRAGHAVTVFERADQPGGLLRYGIPEFKMEKRHLDRRLAQMAAEGTEFRCGITAGDGISAAALRNEYSAIILAGGCTVPRALPVPGADLDGIHQAMEYLPQANRAVAARSTGAEPARDLRGGQARGDHRRRRHRRGLPGHGAAAGRAVRHPAGDPAPAAGRPVRPASPGPRTRCCTGCPARTRRAATGCTPCPPRSSSPTPTAGSGRCGWLTWKRPGARSCP